MERAVLSIGGHLSSRTQTNIHCEGHYGHRGYQKRYDFAWARRTGGWVALNVYKSSGYVAIGPRRVYTSRGNLGFKNRWIVPPVGESYVPRCLAGFVPRSDDP